MPQIETISAADAIKAAQDADVVIVDIRDPREIERDGKHPRRVLLHPRHAGILDRSAKPLRQADLPGGQEVHLPLRRRAALGARGQDRAGHGPEAGRAYGRRLRRLARRRRPGREVGAEEEGLKLPVIPGRARASNPECSKKMDCRVKPGDDPE